MLAIAGLTAQPNWLKLFKEEKFKQKHFFHAEHFIWYSLYVRYINIIFLKLEEEYSDKMFVKSLNSLNLLGTFSTLSLLNTL